MTAVFAKEKKHIYLTHSSLRNLLQHNLFCSRWTMENSIKNHKRRVFSWECTSASNMRRVVPLLNLSKRVVVAISIRPALFIVQKLVRWIFWLVLSLLFRVVDNCVCVFLSSLLVLIRVICGFIFLFQMSWDGECKGNVVKDNCVSLGCSFMRCQLTKINLTLWEKNCFYRRKKQIWSTRKASWM